jgi:hypothetical protein
MLLRAVLDTQDGKDVLRHLAPQPEVGGKLMQKSPLSRFHSSVNKNEIGSQGKGRSAKACRNLPRSSLDDVRAPCCSINALVRSILRGYPDRSRIRVRRRVRRTHRVSLTP